MFKFIVYSRKSRTAQDGHTQHTHLTAEWEINNYLQSLKMQNIPYEIVETHHEDFSGGGYYTRRPIFSDIVRRCKEDRSLTLLASKADRIARDAWTGAELIKTINMVIAANPDADDTMKQILFTLSEHEYTATSKRFKAMYQAKAKRAEEAGEDLVWGGSSPKWKESFEKNKHNHKPKAHHEKANQEIQPTVQLVKDMLDFSNQTLTMREVANKLNERNITTPRGAQWTQAAVSRLVKRHCIEYKNKPRGGLRC